MEDRLRTLSVLRNNVLLPFIIQLLAAFPQCAFNRSVDRHCRQVRKIFCYSRYCVGAVRFRNVFNQRETGIVRRLVAETRLPENAHLAPREHISVQRIHTKNHIAVRVPIIVTQLRAIVLRHAFCKPAWNDETRNRIRHNDVRISVKNVLAPLGLVAEPLEINPRNVAAEFHRRLDLDDVRELVCDNITEPIVSAAKIKVERRSPEFDLVVVKIGGAVGVVVVIFEDDTDLLVRLMMVERGHRAVNIFSNFCNDSRASFFTVVVVDKKMGCLDGEPIQLGVVEVLVLSMERGRKHNDRQNCERSEMEKRGPPLMRAPEAARKAQSILFAGSVHANGFLHHFTTAIFITTLFCSPEAFARICAK